MDCCQCCSKLLKLIFNHPDVSQRLWQTSVWNAYEQCSWIPLAMEMCAVQKCLQMPGRSTSLNT